MPNARADAFREVSPGGNYLGAQHTLVNFRTANYESEMADTNSFEAWEASGSKDSTQRAYERWTAMLEEYIPPPIDPAVDESLQAFMVQKKASMTDQWY